MLRKYVLNDTSMGMGPLPIIDDESILNISDIKVPAAINDLPVPDIFRKINELLNTTNVTSSTTTTSSGSLSINTTKKAPKKVAVSYMKISFGQNTDNSVNKSPEKKNGNGLTIVIVVFLLIVIGFFVIRCIQNNSKQDPIISTNSLENGVMQTNSKGKEVIVVFDEDTDCKKDSEDDIMPTNTNTQVAESKKEVD